MMRGVVVAVWCGGLAVARGIGQDWSCGVPDAHGCCRPYFYCGSNARCTQDNAECADLLAAAPPCSGTVSGVKYDLSRLRLVRGGANYEAQRSNASRLAYNVCANAEASAACRNATPAVGFETATCARLAGSVSSASPVFAALGPDPSRGVRVTYGDGDPCGASRRSLRLDIQCDPSATEPVVDFVRGDCDLTIAIRSAAGCPTGCVADATGAVCSGRGDCAWTPDDGARCDCDRDYTGRACDKVASSSSSRDFQLAAWIWQGAAALLVSVTGALAVAGRCRALRRARAAELDSAYLRYRAVATTPGQEADDGLELHRPLNDVPHHLLL